MSGCYIAMIFVLTLNQDKLEFCGKSQTRQIQNIRIRLDWKCVKLGVKQSFKNTVSPTNLLLISNSTDNKFNVTPPTNQLIRLVLLILKKIHAYRLFYKNSLDLCYIFLVQFVFYLQFVPRQTCIPFEQNIILCRYRQFEIMKNKIVCFTLIFLFVLFFCFNKYEHDLMMQIKITYSKKNCSSQ